MSQALYQKYRPNAFKDVIGQDHIVKVLDGSIREKKIAHAYLFSGSRGTGKTSVARIFAKEIGCSQNDIYEIDAASNRGIDDIRAIRDGVHVSPFESPYKVYIIDEVHMLTKEAFNALLKTLEEPPSHVVFILATTELDKVPETILSRCQTFQFRRPTQSLLKEMILRVAESEGYTLANSSAELVALLAQGSFRDAQGILQKILSFSKDKTIDPQEVETVTGAPNSVLIIECTEALSAGVLGEVLRIVDKVTKDSIDPRLFLSILLQKIRFVLLIRFAPDMIAAIEEQVPEEEFKALSKIAKEKTSRIQSGLLTELLRAYDEIPYAGIPSLPIELACIRSLGEVKDK